MYEHQNAGSLSRDIIHVSVPLPCLCPRSLLLTLFSFFSSRCPHPGKSNQYSLVITCSLTQSYLKAMGSVSLNFALQPT